MSPTVTIDYVTEEPGGWIKLYLVEDEEWPMLPALSSAKLETIRARIRGAIAVAQRGHLAKAHPVSQGKRVQIVVASPRHGCPPALVALVREMDRELQDSETGSAKGDIPEVNVVTNDDLKVGGDWPSAPQNTSDSAPN